MIYPNECPSCGRPKQGGVYCAKCWSEHCKPQSIYCITAGKNELAEVVARKEKEGLKKHGEALAIGGWVVQMMVESKLCGS